MDTHSTSIHYRRRWYYVLWSVLLAASVGLLVLWRIPARSGEATIRLQLWVKDAPAGTRVGVWVGPRALWKGGKPEEIPSEPLSPNGKLVLTRTLPVAYQRWVGGCIPGKTADQVVLVFQPVEGPVRYLSLSLREDWDKGVLQPGRKMFVAVQSNWKGLRSVRPQLTQN